MESDIMVNILKKKKQNYGGLPDFIWKGYNFQYPLVEVKVFCSVWNISRRIQKHRNHTENDGNVGTGMD